MVIARRTLEALIAMGAAAATTIAIAGCGLVPTSRADCNVVRLQREAGRSDSDIAVALGVSEGDISACGAAAAPESAEGMGAAQGAGGAAQAAPSVPSGGAGGGAETGSNTGSPSGAEAPPNY
jgi:hypothetical protein